MSNRRILTFGLLGMIAVALGVFLASRVIAPTAASEVISPEQYQAQFVSAKQDHLLIDVRTPEEFAGGYIPGAVNIPLQELSERLSEIPKDKSVVVYCRSGNRSAQAVSLLTDAGYNRLYDLGGIIDWQAKGLALAQ